MKLLHSNTLWRDTYCLEATYRARKTPRGRWKCTLTRAVPTEWPTARKRSGSFGPNRNDLTAPSRNQPNNSGRLKTEQAPGLPSAARPNKSPREPRHEQQNT
eukprot:IDg9147t1